MYIFAIHRQKLHFTVRYNLFDSLSIFSIIYSPAR